MISPEGDYRLRVDPPGASLAVIKRGSWLVVCQGLRDFWDQQVVADKLRTPWQPLKKLVESKHEPGTYHEVFRFDEDGNQLGSQDFAEGVTSFSFGEDNVMIAVVGMVDAVRVMREASERLDDAYARRRESLEKLGIPTTPSERKSFLMGKVGGSDKYNFAQVIKERQSVKNGRHPQLRVYDNWPDRYLAGQPRQDS